MAPVHSRHTLPHHTWPGDILIDGGKTTDVALRGGRGRFLAREPYDFIRPSNKARTCPCAQEKLNFVIDAKNNKGQHARGSWASNNVAGVAVNDTGPGIIT